LGAEDIHGWFIVAHGDENTGMLGDYSDADVAPEFLTSAQHHKLALAVYYVCYAGKRKKSALPGFGYGDVISPNGSLRITEESIWLFFTKWDEIPE
jgi:hypothetical protein